MSESVASEAIASAVPSRQEMFNRAWNGLKSQGWRKAVTDTGACVYLNEKNDRCAWGWVDLEGTKLSTLGSVSTLHDCGIGLAAKLHGSDLLFAQKLQNTHDCAFNLCDAMRRLAEVYGLTIPDETPPTSGTGEQQNAALTVG